MNDIADRMAFGDVNSFSSVEDFEKSLCRLLGSGCYIHDGQLIHAKQLVGRSDGVKIEVYSDEHVPPHFHVKGNGINASFRIQDCSLLKGDVAKKELKLIEYWFERNRDRLIEVWNKTRPADCPVGMIH